MFSGLKSWSASSRRPSSKTSCPRRKRRRRSLETLESRKLLAASLEGFASLPADTFAEGPDAGAEIAANGRTGPFDGQPVQGFSGVQYSNTEGSFYFLSDNGFGAKTNSADYLLRIYEADPSFTGAEGGDGSVDVGTTEGTFIQLSDPNNLIPFDIVNEDTPDRMLTGADFDIESFVVTTDGNIWVGDEFGPFLLEFDSQGVLQEAPIPTPDLGTPDPLNTLNGQDPLVIGHRGASGERPEHTLEAYELAIQQGADFVEPDLVITKDGILIARHENELGGTTNVSELPQFADRFTTKMIDGAPVAGWFAEDFTLAEIKELRSRERIPGIRPDNTDFNDLFEIPTFQEVIELVQEVEASTGKEIGIYPETKHPTFFAKEGNFRDGTPINASLGQAVIDTLVATGFTDPNRIFIQSFEFENLLELQNDIMPAAGVDIPLVQLFGDTDGSFKNAGGGGFSVPYDFVYNINNNNFADFVTIYGDFLQNLPSETLLGIFQDGVDYGDFANADALDTISSYAEGLGPWKNNILIRESAGVSFDYDGDGNAEVTTKLTGEVFPLIDWAHNANMQVHPYTLRAEETFLTLAADADTSNLTTDDVVTMGEDISLLVGAGADGFFTDFPGQGREVVDTILGHEVRSPDNPAVLSGIVDSNLPRSRGFEGMAISPDKTTLYPMLEGTVDGDPAGTLRIYEFDVASGQYMGLAGMYELDAANHAIGDLTVINENEFLVIERDGGQGESAMFKKVFKIDLSDQDSSGIVAKTEVVDLLNVNDPADLNGDGETTFTFPFVTIEDVLVIDSDTILVANDNNYPFSVGRGPDIDNNEIILLTLDMELDVDPRIIPDLSLNPMMVGLGDYQVDDIFTVGQDIDGYFPPGIPDGMGAFELDADTVRVLVNHELRSGLGYSYRLANGTELTGARVSYFDIDKGTREVVASGLAYDTIIGADGQAVTDPATLGSGGGLSRLCSAMFVQGGTYGFVDDIFFTGEESSSANGGLGGLEYALDVAENTLYALPSLGYAAWENVTPLDTGNEDTTALLVGDDRGGAPLLLWVGDKGLDAEGESSNDFLARNGLAHGTLYAWKADNGDTNPEDFNGTGESRSGSWVVIEVEQEFSGVEVRGIDFQDFQVDLLDAFQFSRPEDVATDPTDGTRAVLASTGRSSLYPSDAWGTTYIVDVDFHADGSPESATLDIIYDGDDAGAGQFAGPDFGLRSPDNLDWADDGSIYIQEDRSVGGFGDASGEEASIWKLSTDTGILTRVAQMDRSAVPPGQVDTDPTDLGDWESSGIIDVSALFGETPGELFLFNVQAHSLRGGKIDSVNLVQGGQLAFLETEIILPRQEMMVGLGDYQTEAIFNVGESIDDYFPPGILDGMGAFELDADTVRVLVNHELTSGRGYAYTLANGTELTGARVSYFDIDKATREVVASGLAYDTVIGSDGNVVTDPATLGSGGGLSRLCSAQFVQGGTYGFEDDIFFTGEESSSANGGLGGLEYALDVAEGKIYALPALGYAAWENVTPIDTGNPDKTALLIGDDRGAAPLYLWVGDKGLDGDRNPSNDFLARNGLAYGVLYAWRADSGETTPEQFNGTGESRSGTWVEIDVEFGSLRGITFQDFQIDIFGAFKFSRPEDVATDPTDGTRAVLASTGRSSLFPSDSWGTTYIVDIDFNASGTPITAMLDIIYDGDDAGAGQFAGPDFGLRSPDNLDWAKDGSIYIQEDRSVGGFGDASGEEASIWHLAPDTGILTRVAQMDRSAVPPGQVDIDPTDLGDWESSGIIDVSHLFGEDPGELMLFNVQAHSLRGGTIDSEDLVQGGQLAFLETEIESMPDLEMMVGLDNYEVEALFTVGDSIDGYFPPGILDGLGAFTLNESTVRVLANHELTSSAGYSYSLANGTELTGARVSYFDIDVNTHEVTASGLAYNKVVGTDGTAVTDPAELGSGGGLSRLCSAQFIQGGTYGFVDDIFLTGEESSSANGGAGGLEYALDVANDCLYALPALGHAAWENVTPIDTGTEDRIALLIGDDRGGAPLYLWVGDKGLDGAGVASNDFLARNGLAHGTLYAWKADSGETTPEEFNGTGQSRTGTWVEIDVELGGLRGIDFQDFQIEATNAFKFSRPEDVATDPNDGTRAVLASTGRSSLYPSDSWGTTYIVDIDFSPTGTPTAATLDIIYDGDDAGDGQFAGPDFGLRSPDNLDWADDGSIYIQEDRSVGGFGDASGEEASIWHLAPESGVLTRVAQMNRSAVPDGQVDTDPTDLGDWESSGIVDVSDLFGEDPGELLLFDVQAHSLRGGTIDSEDLVQGGQLALLRKQVDELFTVLGS